LNNLANTILADFPHPYDMEAATIKFKMEYNESMNTVLTQELNRFNELIKIIIKSLKELIKALKGEILMSSQLEKASKSLFDGKVPDMWKGHSYPSLKPLASYIIDLKNRIAFFQKWLDQGQPDSFWISGLFFTQSFLTGVMQNYARKYTIPIDELVFEFEVKIYFIKHFFQY
jgi:dynein heavy chain, axonemal